MADKKPVVRPEYKNNAERLAALKRAARSTNTKLGIECVTMASDISDTKRAPFGIKEVDDFCGGGIPHGSFTVIWGGAGSGKTTLGLNLAKRAQDDGKLVAWIGLEPFPKDRAELFKINLDEMPVISCPQAEQSLDIIIEYARKKLVDVIILDSIHSLAPKAIQENAKGEKSLSDDTMARLASKLSDFFKIAIDPIKRSEMAVLFIGQTRLKLGIISIDCLTGGNALLHNSRLTIHTRRGAKDDSPTKRYTNVDGKKVEEIIGFPCVLKLDKVQVSGSQKEQSVLSIPYYYESGFELPKEIKEEVAQEEAEIALQDAPEATKEEKAGVESDGVGKSEYTPAMLVAEGFKKKRGRKPGTKNKSKDA